MRHLVSILIAVVASLIGSVALWIGGGRTLYEISRWGAEAAFTPFLLVAVLGAVLLGAAAFSIRFSPAGVLVVGGFTVLMTLLLVAFPNDPIRGVASPFTAVIVSLNRIDPALTMGIINYLSFGPAALIGFAFLGAGLVARVRRATAVWRVLSAVGGVLAIGFALGAILVGGEFYRASFVMLQASLLAAAGLVVTALLFGLALAPSGRSSIGAWVAGGVLTVIGIVVLLAPPASYSVLPRELLYTLSTVGWSGMVLAVGVTLLGLALGVTLRRPVDATVPPAAPAASSEPAVVPPPYVPPAAEPASGASV
mgnify:CR=1 FL=1